MKRVSSAKWMAVPILLAGLAGRATAATVTETYTVAPSGETGTFIASPSSVNSFVENEGANPGVTLSFKATPAKNRHIVSMYLFISQSLRHDGTIEYTDPIVIQAEPSDKDPKIWLLPTRDEQPLVIKLNNQSVAAPTKVYVYVVEQDDKGKSYGTLIETHYSYFTAADFRYNPP